MMYQNVQAWRNNVKNTFYLSIFSCLSASSMYQWHKASWTQQRLGAGFIFWLHPLGWRHISWWEPQIWKLIEMLQLYDGDNFAGMFCPLSGQSDSGNMGGLWARVHLDVSALVASLRAPQRTSLWMRAAWRFCSFSKLYYALLMVSITPTQ